MRGPDPFDNGVCDRLSDGGVSLTATGVPLLRRNSFQIITANGTTLLISLPHPLPPERLIPPLGLP